ncbi:hypothetical protein CEXT_736611 [Caerostris extrusa]|uniref:Uncharacterized protein n=1 Tax=Caerostris extrusa TaxID=172846 RepID=A0AAV4V158_CAEEX|nr:hypothetical protein CEXT_736611 [Caerostris extrusa]
MEQSGIDLIQSLFFWISGIDLIQVLSSGPIRNRFPSISLNSDQSGIDLIQSLFIWINQESISSKYFSAGSTTNPFHPISSHHDQ